MRTKIGLGVVLVGCALASAQPVELRLFWTQTGLLSNQDNMTERNFIPDWDPTPPEPVNAVFGDDVPAGQNSVRMYLWVEFVSGFEPFDLRIIGMQLDVSGTASTDNGVAYRHRKSGVPGTRWQRWQSGNPIQLNHGVMAALGVDTGIMPWDSDALTPGVDIFDLGTGRRFLIGSVAVQIPVDGPKTLIASPDTLGIEVKRLDEQSFQVPVPPTPPVTIFPRNYWLPCCRLDGTCNFLYVSSCRAACGKPLASCVECSPVQCPGDMQCDGQIDFADIDMFVEVLTAASVPGACDEIMWERPCSGRAADCNADGAVTFQDIDAFVALIGTTCDPL